MEEAEHKVLRMKGIAKIRVSPTQVVLIPQMDDRYPLYLDEIKIYYDPNEPPQPPPNPEKRYNSGKNYTKDEHGRFTGSTGGGGSGGSSGGGKSDKTVEKSAESGIIITNKQLGKKLGRHATEWGLNPSLKTDRDKMIGIINDIVNNSDEVKIGEWRGQEKDVLFHIKKQDVVITSQSNEFISILKGGVTNGRVKDARKHKVP